MEYREFANEIRRHKGPFKIRNSWGIYNAYKLLRKNKWYDIGRPLKEHEFYSIIREINDLLAENIVNGETVVFPHRMGKLELRKFECGANLVNGRLKITYPIDWEETVRLWFVDEEAKRNKTLLRKEEKYLYTVKYNKYAANYDNKSFYQFALNKFIKRALKHTIKEGKIDTLW